MATHTIATGTHPKPTSKKGNNLKALPINPKGSFKVNNAWTMLVKATAQIVIG